MEEIRALSLCFGSAGQAGVAVEMAGGDWLTAAARASLIGWRSGRGVADWSTSLALSDVIGLGFVFWSECFDGGFALFHGIIRVLLLFK